MKFKKMIEVANPSVYARSDYVELNLDILGVPQHLGVRPVNPNAMKIEITLGFQTTW